MSSRFRPIPERRSTRQIWMLARSRPLPRHHDHHAPLLLPLFFRATPPPSFPPSLISLSPSLSSLSSFALSPYFSFSATACLPMLLRAAPRHATPRHSTPLDANDAPHRATPRYTTATPVHSTPRHATPRYATPRSRHAAVTFLSFPGSLRFSPTSFFSSLHLVRSRLSSLPVGLSSSRFARLPGTLRVPVLSRTDPISFRVLITRHP